MGPDERKLKVDQKTKREVVAALLKAGRRDLAVTVANPDLERQVIQFFKQNPNPPDSKVHELAEKLNVNPHDLETVIYSLLTKQLVNAKLFVGKTYDVRETLKRNRGRWDPNAKAWDVPDKFVPAIIQVLRKRGFDVIEHPDRIEIRRGSGSAPSQPSAPRRPGQASEKQVRYAQSLLNRLIRSGGWHDSDLGQFGPPPRLEDIEKMSSRDISALIDSLKGEF